MWSPKKLNFLFYNFYMIYYNFSNIQPKKYKRKGGKRPRKTNQGDNMSGIASLRSPNGRFCGPRRKRGLDP